MRGREASDRAHVHGIFWCNYEDHLSLLVRIVADVGTGQIIPSRKKQLFESNFLDVYAVVHK